MDAGSVGDGREERLHLKGERRGRTATSRVVINGTYHYCRFKCIVQFFCKTSGSYAYLHA